MEQKTLYRQIAVLGKKHHAKKVVLFGSRARGDQRERSDIDLAVYGLTHDRFLDFCEDIDELPTLLSFDVINMDGSVSPELIHNIEKDGVDLMAEFTDKYTKFCSSVDRLRDAINKYSIDPDETVRDGVIQRFEFCTELAWKTVREHLLDQGYVNINSPKAVLRTAYSDGIIDNERLWISLLNDRNQTSHVYSEDTAQEIFQRIQADYYPVFCELREKLH